MHSGATSVVPGNFLLFEWKGISGCRWVSPPPTLFPSTVRGTSVFAARLTGQVASPDCAQSPRGRAQVKSRAPSFCVRCGEHPCADWSRHTGARLQVGVRLWAALLPAIVIQSPPTHTHALGSSAVRAGSGIFMSSLSLPLPFPIPSTMGSSPGLGLAPRVLCVSVWGCSCASPHFTS